MSNYDTQFRTQWYEEPIVRAYIEHSYKGPWAKKTDVVSGRVTQLDFEKAMEIWLIEHLELKHEADYFLRQNRSLRLL